jgi:hypothetical protein
MSLDHDAITNVGSHVSILLFHPMGRSSLVSAPPGRAERHDPPDTIGSVCSRTGWFASSQPPQAGSDDEQPDVHQMTSVVAT